VIVVLAVVCGFLAGRLAWVVLRPTFELPVFARSNFRGVTVPTAAGIILPIAALLVEAARAVVGGAGIGDEVPFRADRVVVLLAVAGFSLLGALDDLAGDGESRGFRGHLQALASGRLTTGAMKLVGGGALALVVVGPRAGGSLSRLLGDALLVALAANLGNLFDRGPGRTIKVGTVAFLLLALLTRGNDALSGVAVVAGAAVAVLLDDLHEHLMLGDTGANALGGVLGLGVVLACAPHTRLLVMIVLLVLNLVSEFVSFTRLIEATPPLRAADRLGRRG
jgi:UDP-GlcNAc:undecaprenyl-phosphate GlcNAc-1-phosphate transferase